MDQMLAEISAPMMAEWEAFLNLDGPPGDERADYRSAQLAALIFNANRGRESAPAKVDDFMPYRRPQLPTEEELAEKVNAIFGGGR